jgi:hypothetical protein
MKRGNLVLFADFALDFLAIAGFIYLWSQGYFTDLSSEDLNSLFLKVGVAGLIMASATIYLLLKKD